MNLAVLNKAFEGLQGALRDMTKVKVINQEPFETKLDEEFSSLEIKTRGQPPQSGDTRFDFDFADPFTTNEVDDADFWSYCDETVPVKKSWCKPLSQQSNLSFSKKMSGTIMNVNAELHEIATMNFKRLTFIMTEELSEIQITDLVGKMLKIGLKNAAEMKDEQYFQAIKQLRGCEQDEDLQIAGWTVLACYSTFFRPSEGACYAIMNFLKNHAQNHHNYEIQTWAKYCYSRLEKNISGDGDRQVLPSVWEIGFIRKHRKMPFTISFFGGGTMDFWIENYTKLEHLKDEIIKR